MYMLQMWDFMPGKRLVYPVVTGVNFFKIQIFQLLVIQLLPNTPLCSQCECLWKLIVICGIHSDYPGLSPVLNQIARKQSSRAVLPSESFAIQQVFLEHFQGVEYRSYELRSELDQVYLLVSLSGNEILSSARGKSQSLCKELFEAQIHCSTYNSSWQLIHFSCSCHCYLSLIILIVQGIGPYGSEGHPSRSCPQGASVP